MVSPRERLKAWREHRCLSQARAAELLGCDQTYVSQIELGKRTPDRPRSNAIQRETADWPEGPIRSTEWDEWEAKQAGTAA